MASLKVLLTGASGFIGTNLSEKLVHLGHEVIGFDMVQPKEPEASKYIYGSLLKDEDLTSIPWQDIDVLVHFAAQARVEPSMTDPIGTYRTNVQATINLLERCKAYDKRIVYASSEIIYGDQDRYPCRESYVLKPDSPYAASKAAADYLVQQCAGVRSVVVRSGMGYGPRSPPSQVVTKMMLKCMDGKPLLFPDKPVRHPTRDVNFVDNFTTGISQVLAHPDVTGVFNMGSGQEVDILTLAEKIIGAVGGWQLKPITVEYDPEFHYRPGEEGKRTWLDNTKAKNAFGYDPKVQLEEGLARTYEWLKNGGRELYGW